MKSFYTFILITTIVFFCVCKTQAAPPKLIWHSGQLTLWNRTVLEGNVSYNWLAEMVMICQPDGRVSTFSANQVLQFGWFDYTQHKYREFKSFPGPIVKDRTNYAFFEVCMDGSLAVVRRIRQPRGLWKRAFGHPANFSDQPTLSQTPDNFDYFVHDAGRLVSLDQFYSEIYTPLMMAYDRELRTYILKHNINPKTLTGSLILVDHYNFLVQQDARMASVPNYGSAPN